MCSPGQSDWQWVAFSPSASHSLSRGLSRYLQRRSRGIPFGFLGCLLFSNDQYPASMREAVAQAVAQYISIPNTKRFFSGKRFPLATPSSSEDHMFFLPSLLVGRLLSRPAALDPRFGLEDIVGLIPPCAIQHVPFQALQPEQSSRALKQAARHKCGIVIETEGGYAERGQGNLEKSKWSWTG